MSLNVMIVDDERDIHAYLKQVIDWDGMGLELVCEAEDAVTARELFALHHPQIVFMDVCIPSFDGGTGLDLAREFCRVDQDIRVIVITGFADFSYAQQALSVGAVDLLLKPLQPVEVSRSLEKARGFFEDKRQRLMSQTALKHLINENVDLLRTRKIAQLLENTEEYTQEQIAEQLRLLSLDILGDQYMVVRFALENSENENAASDINLYQLAVQKMCEQTLLENGYKICTYFTQSNILSCIISWKGEDRKDQLEKLLDKLSDDVLLCFSIKIKLGLGTRITDLRQLSVSANCAQQSFLLEETAGHNLQKNHLVLLAKKYVKENLTDPNLGFDEVCNHIGITKIYFGRLFQKEEGISFGAYINQCRIEQAKIVLEKTNLRVSEVADEVGFSNTKYFSVIFKSVTGMTPLDYRRSKRFSQGGS